MNKIKLSKTLKELYKHAPESINTPEMFKGHPERFQVCMHNANLAKYDYVPNIKKIEERERQKVIEGINKYKKVGKK